MEHQDFIQAKSFIYKDITRELQLASASKLQQYILKVMGITPGGANFMSALALLSYTEFVGKIKFGYKKTNGEDHASRNFNAFFDTLGEEYKLFRKTHDVYDLIRCGLVHEYTAKHAFEVVMFGRASMGIIFRNNKYYFIVDKYFQDFRIAFDKLEKEKFKF